MKTLKNLTQFLSLLFLLAPQAQAEFFGGDTVGNGGDVIVCAQGGKLKAEVLDYFEAVKLHRRHIFLGGPEASLHEKMEMLFERVAADDPARARLYREHFKTFFQESNFLTEIKLADVPDSNNIILPDGECEIRQAVVQITPYFPEDKRYLFSDSLWQLLDTTNKAVLVFHEIVYRDVLRQTRLVHKNSRVVRYYVGRIAAGDLLFRSQKERIAFYENTLGFESVSAEAKTR